MSAFREPGFKERQEAAAKAKQAALDKLRARQKPVEPAVVQQADRVSRTKERSPAKGARATEKTEKKAAGKAAPKAARKARGK
jgi:Family of unknown function (DUF6481)